MMPEQMDQEGWTGPSWDNVPCGNEDVKRLLDVGGLVGASEITMRAVWVMLVVG